MDHRRIVANAVAPRRWAGLAVLATAAFVVSLDTMVLYVAFAEIHRDFPDVTAASLSWILSGYTIVIAAGMIGAGRWADRLGRRRLFLAGMGLFTVASAICAAAPGVVVLWAGVGVAMIMPLLTSAAVAGLPSDRFATGSAVNAALRNVGQTLGVAIFVALVGGAAGADLLARHRLAWWLVAAAGIAVTATSWWLPTPTAGLVRSPAAGRPTSASTFRSAMRVDG